MKKYLVASLLLSMGAMQAQLITNYLVTNDGTTLDLQKKLGGQTGEKATGTPYIISTFMLGSISNVKEPIMLRYNGYSDEMDINGGDGEVFVLPKQPELSEVTMTVSKKKYVLSDYTNDDDKKTKGYLAEIFSQNGVSLLKRERVVLIPEKQPKNGYGAYQPARYERSDDEFYIKLKSGAIVAFPKNKKKLIELFPEKKEDINVFFKSNDLSFKVESEMSEITKFTSTL